MISGRSAGLARPDQGKVGLGDEPVAPDLLGEQATGLDDRADAPGRDAQAVGSLGGGEVICH